MGDGLSRKRSVERGGRRKEKKLISRKVGTLQTGGQEKAYQRPIFHGTSKGEKR